jgi:hypothetical protein
MQETQAGRESTTFGLDTAEIEKRISDLEEYADLTYRSGNQNDNLAVRELESKLSLKIDVLEDVLAKTGQLNASYELVSHRKRFDEVCANSEWCPSADFLEVFELDAALNKMMSYSDMGDIRSVRAASLSSGHLKGLLHRVASGRVEMVLTTVKQEPVKSQEHLFLSWDILELIEQDAEEEWEHLDDLRALLRKVAQAQLKKCATCSSTEIPSMEAQLQQYLRSGYINQDELLEAKRGLLEAKERTAAVDRKLRSAVSWATSKDTAKLEQAIKDAKAAGADPKEIVKAEQMLKSLLPQEGQKSVPVVRQSTEASSRRTSRSSTMSLYAFLQQAVPEWPPSSVAGALEKLQRVLIFTVDDLSEVLLDHGEEHLTALMRDANLKLFKVETLQILKIRCQQLGL